MRDLRIRDHDREPEGVTPQRSIELEIGTHLRHSLKSARAFSPFLMLMHSVMRRLYTSLGTTPAAELLTGDYCGGEHARYSSVSMMAGSARRNELVKSLMFAVALTKKRRRSYDGEVRTSTERNTSASGVPRRREPCGPEAGEGGKRDGRRNRRRAYRRQAGRRWRGQGRPKSTS